MRTPFRDFVPEEKEQEIGRGAPGRDFIPEGGLSDEETALKVTDPGRREPPGQAPLNARDFIHEAIVEPDAGEEAAPPPLASAPAPERPPVPRPEDRAGEFEIPPGYELKGVDPETGEPIIRRKSGRLTKEEQAAKEAWEKEQAARAEAEAEAEGEEAGKKGGEGSTGAGHRQIPHKGGRRA